MGSVLSQSTVGGNRKSGYFSVPQGGRRVSRSIESVLLFFLPLLLNPFLSNPPHQVRVEGSCRPTPAEKNTERETERGEVPELQSAEITRSRFRVVPYAVVPCGTVRSVIRGVGIYDSLCTYP